jgi:hypothetical protein
MHVALALLCKLKLWENYVVCFSPASRKIQDYVIKEKEFENLEDLLVSLNLYFVIFEDNSCISRIYYLLLL